MGGLQTERLGRVRRLVDAAPVDLVEEQGRPLELMQDEHDDPDQQDEELHWNLEQSIEQEAQTAVGDRAARKVPLDLRLIGAEVGHRQKEAARQA